MTHPNKEGENALSVQLLTQFPELKGVGLDPLRPGIVHRLDKETSGVMVIARTNAMYDNLRKQFDGSKVEKEYVALVYGLIQKDQGVIHTSLSRSNKGQFTTSDEGRDAITEYTVTKRYKEFTLVQLHPKTGRTHQLRVHMKSMGHPILGDPLYRAKINVRIDFLRLFLHAASIKFTDLSGTLRDFEAPLPETLTSFLRKQESTRSSDLVPDRMIGQTSN